MPIQATHTPVTAKLYEEVLAAFRSPRRQFCLCTKSTQGFANASLDMVLYYILYYIQAWYFCTILYVRRMFLRAALALPVLVSDCAFRWHGRVALLPVLSDSSAPVPAPGCNFSAVPWSYSHFEAPAQASLLVALWLAFDTDHAAARHHWLSPPSHKNHCGTLLNSFAVKVATICQLQWCKNQNTASPKGTGVTC